MSEEPPVLSVIIACVNGSPMIEECLACLGRQRGEVEAEVLVADATGKQTLDLLRRQFPWVKLLAFPEGTTIPELRRAALDHSRGEIVAVIEDHCNPGPDWYQTIVEAHYAHPECVAVGGAVENGSPERLVDWAVFFCEYASHMLPLAGGITPAIPGNNVSYKRQAFEGLENREETLGSGFWESTLHPRLLARGEQFLLNPSMVVYHKKRFGFRYFLRQRFHYSRYYSGTLFSQAGWRTRLLRSALSAALPPLLMGRIVARVARKRRHRRELLLTTPLLATFVVAWAMGELVGCLGGPGDSLSRVE